MDVSQVYVHPGQGQQQHQLNLRQLQQKQQQPYPGVGSVQIQPGSAYLEQRTQGHREVERRSSNTEEIVSRKIAADVNFIIALWKRSGPYTQRLIHQLLSRNSQNNEDHLWMMIFQEARRVNLTQEFYREPEIMEQLRKWYEKTKSRPKETWELEHKVVGVESNIPAAREALNVLQTILTGLGDTGLVRSHIRDLITSNLGVEKFTQDLNQSAALSRDLKLSLPHLKVAFIEGKVHINSIQAFNNVDLKLKPFDKADMDIEEAKKFELFSVRAVGYRGSTVKAEENVEFIKDLLRGNLSFEEFASKIYLPDKDKSRVKQCFKQYMMAVFYKQLKAESLINEMNDLLEILQSNEKFLIDKRDSLTEESERSQFIADIHSALESPDSDVFFTKYFSQRPELKGITGEILNRFRTGDLLIPETLRLPTLHIPESRGNEDLRTPSPVEDEHGLTQSMPIIVQSESSMESGSRNKEDLLAQANKVLRPEQYSNKLKDNRFQQHLVSVFQKRKLTLANLKTVKENLILLVNGGMTLESFLGQKLLMPEKLSSNDFELKVKNLEHPFRDFVEGLKNGSFQPKKLHWTFGDIIFDKLSGMFLKYSTPSRSEEAINLASTVENQDPNPSERISRTQLILDFRLLASWKIQAPQKKQRSLTAIFTSSYVIFSPNDWGLQMDIGHEIRNSMFPDGRSGKLFLLPSNEKSEKLIEESFIWVKSLRDFEDCFLNINGGAETTTVFGIFEFETLSHEYEKKNNCEYKVFSEVLHPQQGQQQDDHCTKMLKNTFGVPVSKEVFYQRVVEFICPVPRQEVPRYGFQLSSFAVEMSDYLVLFPTDAEYEYFNKNCAFGQNLKELNLKICTIGNEKILKFIIPSMSKIVHASILQSSMLRNDAHLGLIKGKKPFAIKHQDCNIFYSRLPQNRISKIDRHKIRKIFSKVECAALVGLKSSSFFVIYFASQPPEFSEVTRFIISVKEGEKICDSYDFSSGVYIEKNEVNTDLDLVFTVRLPLKGGEFRTEKVQMIKSRPEVSYACNRKESVLTNTTPTLFEKMTSWTCVFGQKSLKFYHPNIRLQTVSAMSPSRSPRSPLTALSRKLPNSPMSSQVNGDAPSPSPPLNVISSPPRRTESPLAVGRISNVSSVRSPIATSAPGPSTTSKVTFKVTSAPNLGSPTLVLSTPSSASILTRDIVFEIDLYSATVEELYEVPGIDDETARFITESRSSAESFEKFLALSSKHKKVFTEKIEFSVGRLGRKKMCLTYRGKPINNYSCKLLRKRKRKLKKNVIKINQVEDKNALEAEKPDPESTLTAEEEEVCDGTSLTIDEDGVQDETISVDADETEFQPQRTIEPETEKQQDIEIANSRTTNNLNVKNLVSVDSNQISASANKDSTSDIPNESNSNIPEPILEALTDTAKTRTGVEGENEEVVSSPPNAHTLTENEDEQKETIDPDGARDTQEILIQEPQPTPEAISEDTDSKGPCLKESGKFIEKDESTTELSNEIVIEPVSGPCSDDEEDDVNDEANFERLMESAEPTENFVEAESSNGDSDKENLEDYPNLPDVSASEACRVLRGSDSANQETELPCLSNEKSVEKELSSKKVTPLKINMRKRKSDQSLTNLSTDEENTEPCLIKAKVKWRKRRKVVKPKETFLKRQSTLDEHFPRKKATKETVFESIFPMKLLMKPVVRVERSKEAECFLHEGNNNDMDEKERESSITLYETFNADENDPRLELIQIHRSLQFEHIRPPKQLENPFVKKFECSACCAVFGSWKERESHYPVHLTSGDHFKPPEKKSPEYQCNLCKESFHSFDKKREHYYGVHASKSTETSQEENITAGIDNDIVISCSSQNAQSPVVVRTVEELMTEADSEPNQEPDIDTTTEVNFKLILISKIMFIMSTLKFYT